MPITGPASFVPVTQDFITHWTSADAALGAGGPIELKGGVGVAQLTTLRNNLVNQRTDVEVARNGLEGARADLAEAKAAILERLNQFVRKLRSVADGTRWVAMLPTVFSMNQAMGDVIQPLDDTHDLWQRYEAAEGPLVLMGGYDRTAFAADLAGLRGLYTAYSSQSNALGLARGKRNETQVAIYEILKQYRQRIPAEFAEGSPIYETLPVLSPPKGATPDAVTITGLYNATTQKADLAWSEVTDATVATLEVRGTAGPDYEAEDENLIATLPANTTPRTFSTDFGLLLPGAASSFKIYSITAEGHYRGSNAVTVTRS